MSKQDKYTKSARMEECMVRIPGVCSFDPETTIPAHLNGAGMGMKHSNIHIAYCCFNCHQTLDGAVNSEFSKDALELMHLQAVIRTQQIMINNGILIL